jgi:hypothetical protein
VGPAGVWVLIPKHQRGKITYSKNRWRQSGGGFVQSYLKIFAQEGIGRPDLEIEAEIDGVSKFLGKRIDDDTEIPEIKAALIFSNPETDIQAEEAPYPTLPAKKLKDLIRKTAKTDSLSPEIYTKIQDMIDPPEITETDAR